MTNSLFAVPCIFGSLVASPLGIFLIWFGYRSGESMLDPFMFFPIGALICGIFLLVSAIQLFQGKRKEGLTWAQLSATFLVLGIVIAFVYR
ncbi:MAG: hypothetical protein AAFX06_11390 [Planctomycetota bacterium]